MVKTEIGKVSNRPRRPYGDLLCVVSLKPRVQVGRNFLRHTDNN